MSAIRMGATAERKYTSGDYARCNRQWHLNDAPGKARGLEPMLRALMRERANAVVADIGSGVGGVPMALSQILASEAGAPRFVGFEIAYHAVAMAREMFPNFDLRHKSFDESDGPFDATMFV